MMPAMTNAREIIARHLCAMAAQGWSGISPFERAAYRTTAAGMVEAITAAGFRVLAPEEVDPVTVEKCAEVADNHIFAMDAYWWLSTTKKEVSAYSCRSVATAIRALCAIHQGDKS